jgi:hypothetical protein
VLLIFLIGVRFVTHSSTSARVVQYAIWLIPSLPEPKDVLVAEDDHVTMR